MHRPGLFVSSAICGTWEAVVAFKDDLAAAVDAFGVDDVGLIWGLANVAWESDSQRDAFLATAKDLYRTE
jgi:hypothetical protein